MLFLLDEYFFNQDILTFFGRSPSHRVHRNLTTSQAITADSRDEKHGYHGASTDDEMSRKRQKLLELTTLNLHSTMSGAFFPGFTR